MHTGQPPVRISPLVDCVGAARNAQDAVLAAGELPLLKRHARQRLASPMPGGEVTGRNGSPEMLRDGVTLRQVACPVRECFDAVSMVERSRRGTIGGIDLCVPAFALDELRLLGLVYTTG
jgi:hypothetical protein